MEQRFVPPRGLLLRLTWPITIELMLQMLLGNVDQLVLSKYSSLAVAAVGNANQIINFFVLLFNIFCTSSLILISQYKGAKDEESAQKLYSIALYTNLCIGLFISLVLLFFHKQFFALMSVPTEVIPIASRYMVFTGSFIFLQGMSLTFIALLKSNAFMFQTMIATAVMYTLNIVSNLILVNGLGFIPPMGVTGVAISTTVSRAVGVFIMAYFFIKNTGVSLKLSTLFPLQKHLYKKLLQIGLPSAGENLAYSLTQLLIMSFVNSFGTLVINTRMYVAMLVVLTHTLCVALSQSTQVIIGRFLGAKQPEDANKWAWKALGISMGTTALLSLGILIFSDQIIGIFTSDPEILALAKRVLFIDMFLEQGRCVNICFIRFLQTSGDIKFPIFLGIFSTWTWAVGLSFVFAMVLGWGLEGIWLAMAIDEIFRSLLFIWRWKQGKWRRRNLIG